MGEKKEKFKGIFEQDATFWLYQFELTAKAKEWTDVNFLLINSISDPAKRFILRTNGSPPASTCTSTVRVLKS